MFANILTNGNPIEEDSPLEGEEDLPMDTGFQSVLEAGDAYQGDIVLTAEQKTIVFPDTSVLNTGLLSAVTRWPKDSKGKVVVPYRFQPAAKHSEYLNVRKL